MTEYVVKIGFWLRAYDSVTVEADADAEAIEKAKIAATTAMTKDTAQWIHRVVRHDGQFIPVTFPGHGIKSKYFGDILPQACRRGTK